MYHFEDLAYQEIAIKLNVSLTKVKTDIRRGRAALFAKLQSSGALRDALDESSI
jgi:RNA polymerase sigma-70 factor (ECF subfamily)